ncbi:hypothetical protein Psal006b_02011 [Piscirickettsia salmonis]|uniref:Uncharacterized protein n=1 Tax=Piscirickettsia salmonis TaxID=1238 RepID=A0A1L6TAU1_PISSA|nr:hypothetical protein [Piscirickettsia salmonis]AKP73615.1 hypothetical protein PSLF89_1787 [Piscirickettsia salmonis LF-89 = ATCC VR-1361]ALB22383.1 hypothetical protein KU39_1200 [Piscirickettsia salmonis]AMA41972.1 hypothetical protein AWJ11_05985 [Piscirickettsia salmonis]AOS34449.1 hypothetical protein AVM72_03200 [Piscirickettsia salmonis]APS59170.1 hypothetical protein AVI53_00125 [Piscirickettsia salmonis]
MITLYSISHRFSDDDWIKLKDNKTLQHAVCALHSIGQFSYTGDFGHWANYANWDKLKDDKTLQQAVNALDSIDELSKDNWAKIAKDKSLRTIISKLHLSNKFTPSNWQKLDKNHEQLKEVNKEIPDLEHYVQDQTKATASTQFSLSVHHAKLEYLTTGKKDKLLQLKSHPALSTLKKHRSWKLTRGVQFLASVVAAVITAPVGIPLAIRNAYKNHGNFFLYKHHTDSELAALKVIDAANNL